MKAGKLAKFLINCFNPDTEIVKAFFHYDIALLKDNLDSNYVEIDIVSLEKQHGQKLPKLYSLRCIDNETNALFNSWEIVDYLEYCDTVSHVLASDVIAPMKGCTLQSVAVFSGGFEMVIWEKRYD